METGKNTRTSWATEQRLLDKLRSLSPDHRRLVDQTISWIASIIEEDNDIAARCNNDPLRPENVMFTLRASPKDNVFDPAPGDPVGDIGAVVIEYRPSSRPRVGRVLCILPSNKLHPYVIWNDCRHRDGTGWITASGTYFETAAEAVKAFGVRIATPGKAPSKSQAVRLDRWLASLPGSNGATTMDDGSSDDGLGSKR